MTNNPKELNLKDKEFTANGVRYIIHNKMCIDRYMEYEMLQPAIGLGITFDELFQNLKRAYAALNKQNFADSAVIIHNMMNGVKDVQEKKRVHPALKMCALFINRENEDLGIYDPNLMEEKINDWTKEGYSLNDFFSLAVNSIPNFREAYLEFEENQK